ncbi:MAG: BrnA antitoxin family protein [Terriglobia bacterium]
MKTYDFSKGKRGPVLPMPPGKERITIRLDTDILEYFRNAVERAGGGNYQTLINNALRAYIERARQPAIEETLRRVIREELRTAP